MPMEFDQHYRIMQGNPMKQKIKKKSHIVCVRVSDDQLEILQTLMNITKKSASSIMRESVKSFVQNFNQIPRSLRLKSERS